MSEQDKLLTTTSKSCCSIDERRHIILCGLVILSKFFESIVYYLLMFRIYKTMEQHYHWTLIDVDEELANISIFLFYITIVSGILADFVFSNFILISISFFTFLIGGLGLTLMNLNVSQKGTLMIDRFCNYIPTKEYTNDDGRLCIDFSIVILYILGFGNSLLLPLFYANTCHQIRKYDVNYVSASLFLCCCSRHIGFVISILTVNYIIEWKILLSVFTISFISSFACSVYTILYGEQNTESITFMKFVAELKHIYSTVFNSLKWYRTVVTTQHEDRSAFSLEMFGLYRLLVCVMPICILVIPGLTLTNMTRVINKRSLVTLSADKKHLKCLCLNNFSNLIYEAAFIISAIAMVLYLIKWRRAGSGRVLSYFGRLFVGTLLAVLAFYYCGIIEWQLHSGKWYLTNDNVTHLFTPAYVLLGVSNNLILITVIEYAYLHSPPWLRYSGIGLAFLSKGTGTLVGYHVIKCMNPNGIFLNFTKDGANNLDYFYYISAVVILAAFAIGLVLIQLMRPDRFTLPVWDEIERSTAVPSNNVNE